MNPVCSNDCAAPLPVVSFSDCAPEVNLSEIEHLLFTKVDSSPITDMASLPEWQSRVSNTSSGPNAIRNLRVIGDMPAPADQETTISGGRVIVVDRTFTVNADVDESNDLNHEAMRQIQCGGSMIVWFVTRSGHIFGGKEGIKASVKANLVLGRGESEIQRYNLVITWKNKFMPQRNVWPLAGVPSESTPTEFDTTLEFDTEDEVAAAGVTGTASATNANQKFEFNEVLPRTGLPQSMSINVGGVLELVVDFTTDYTGQYFRYTDKAGTAHTGQFTNGVVNF